MYLNSGSENLVENNIVVDCGRELMYFHKWTDGQIDVLHVGTRGLGMRRNTVRRNILAVTGDSVPPVNAFGKCVDANGELYTETNTISASRNSGAA